MICPSCGTPTVPGARFCFACGTALPDAGSESEAERRVVTVLFGDLTDFTAWAEDLDPERVGGVTDRVLATLAAVVTAFGGHVDKLTGDGLMAVFGAPTAHEDDPERAVRAAAGMQAAVRRVVEEEGGGGRRLGLRVGLNTGVVLAGVQAHLSYTVVGDTVNTAARLSDAAGPGAVLAGKDTAAATMPVASWRALPPLRLKGKREPVEAYELVAVRPPGAAPSLAAVDAPFLGRDAELGLLIGRLLDVAERESPRSVVLTGEAGVGKTRLAQELARFAGELPTARVLWGHFPPYGVGRDLAALAEVVRTACGIADHAEAALVAERVERTVARLSHPASEAALAPGTTEALLALLGVDEAELGRAPLPRETAAPGAAPSPDAARGAVAQLLTALARSGPVLVVLDDLQWATPAARESVAALGGGLEGPVLLVGAGRPDALAEPWWEQLPQAELLPLLPLEDPAVERLLRAHLGGAELEPDVRSALLSRAEGNPFFLAELLHLLVDRGVLVRDGARWVLQGEVPTEIPAGVRAVLAARIDALDGAAKGVLRDAAVIGPRFGFPALEAVGRASGHGRPDVVRAAVRELVDRRLLEQVDDGAYRFTHTLVRDVAYAGLAKAERARRHAAAAAHALASLSAEADAVAAAQGERAVRLAAEMALPPGDPSWAARGVAFTALARLGQVALGRRDPLEADRLLSRAEAVAQGAALPDDLVLPVRLARAQALAALHRLEEAAEHVAPVLEGGEDALRAAALVVLGEVRRKARDAAGARAAFVSALAAASTAGIDRVTAEALRQLGLLDYFEGRLRAAEQRFAEALSLAERVGDRGGAAWALQHLAWSATTRGDYPLAERTLGQAAELFAALDDAGGLSWTAGTEGFVRLLQGRFREARDLARAVLPHAEGSGERWGIASVLTIDALAAAELGDLQSARDESDRAVALFGELGDTWGSALALVAAGVTARGLAETERAVELLGRAAATADEGGHPVVASLALVAEGYVHLDRGDPDAAERVAQRAAALLGAVDLEPTAALGAAVLLAQVRRARGELADALAELDRALAVGAEPALLFPRRQALAHRAGTLLALGRVDEALAAAHVALAEPAEDVRSKVVALRALAAAAAASGDAEGARRALQEAVETSRATGHRGELAATRRALAALA